MSLIGKTVEEQMWNFFMARVGNAYGVAALMGHWFAESGLNPRNLQNSFEKKLGYTDEAIRRLLTTAAIRILSMTAPDMGWHNGLSGAESRIFSALHREGAALSEIPKCSLSLAIRNYAQGTRVCWQ